MNRSHLLYGFFLFFFSGSIAQLVPSINENIPHLVTIGKNASLSFGDDDHKQAFFFAIPVSHKSSFYIRIYDPGTGGELDEQFGAFDTKTKFSFYGGSSVYSSCKGKDAPRLSEMPFGDELYSQVYGNEEKYDSSWHTIGPFNPSEGEYVESFDAYVIKVVAECISGNDGNLYNYFLSSSDSENIPIIASNAFTFEFTIRMDSDPKEVSHLYPFVDNDVQSIKFMNFDFDGADVTLFSRKRFSEDVSVSGDGVWLSSSHKIYESERESCLDIRVSNRSKENDGVVSVKNHYGEYLPFMSAPIGDFTFRNNFIIE